MPGQVLFKQGALDNDNMAALNAGNDWIVANASTGIPGLGTPLGFASFGTAITLLPAGSPAGTYTVTIYGVVTTTIVTATTWSFVLGFTDDKQAQTPTAITSSTLTAGTANQGQYSFRSTGATAITITPTAASISAGAIQYTVVLQRCQ
jgi:hypothetical protein